MDERELVERLRRGEPEAFDRVYEAERSAIYGFLLRLSRDRSVAADLFQNVWLKLAQNAAQLREDSNLRAWLLTVARREFLSFRRAQALDVSRLLLLGLASHDVADGPDDDSSRTLALALDRLVEADRELLLLSALGDLDSDALAQTLGISGEALRQRLTRARRRLAQALDDLEQVPAATLPKGTH
ncbi:MAG TPA: RNA polymerase sigma factor [Polyangiaceae bacterium]|nr:RNA polymerase sigma factor [Polyangiaceae bacterium]